MFLQAEMSGSILLNHKIFISYEEKVYVIGNCSWENSRLFLPRLPLLDMHKY